VPIFRVGFRRGACPPTPARGGLPPNPRTRGNDKWDGADRLSWETIAAYHGEAVGLSGMICQSLCPAIRRRHRKIDEGREGRS